MFKLFFTASLILLSSAKALAAAAFTKESQSATLNIDVKLNRP